MMHSWSTWGMLDWLIHKYKENEQKEPSCIFGRVYRWRSCWKNGFWGVYFLCFWCKSFLWFQHVFFYYWSVIYTTDYIAEELTLFNWFCSSSQILFPRLQRISGHFVLVIYSYVTIVATCVLKLLWYLCFINSREFLTNY